MKKSTLLIVIFGIAIFGCATENTVLREPQQVGGDVGMKHINVESLSMQNAGSRMKIAFRGSEAESLYNTLPKSVLREDPEQSVGFLARGKVNSVLIRCAKKRFDGDDRSYHFIPGGPLCTVSIEKTRPQADIMQNRWIFPAQE